MAANGTGSFPRASVPGPSTPTHCKIELPSCCPRSPGEVAARTASKPQFSISLPSAALWAHPACFLPWNPLGFGDAQKPLLKLLLFSSVTLHHPKGSSKNVQTPLAAAFPVLQSCSATLWAHPASSKPGNPLGFGMHRTQLGSAGRLQSRGKDRIAPEEQPGHTRPAGNTCTSQPLECHLWDS